MQQLVDPAGMVKAAVGFELEAGNVAQLQLLPELGTEKAGCTIERGHERVGPSTTEWNNERRRVAQIGADMHFRYCYLDALQIRVAKVAASQDACQDVTQLLADAELPLAWGPAGPSRHPITTCKSVACSGRRSPLGQPGKKVSAVFVRRRRPVPSRSIRSCRRPGYCRSSRMPYRTRSLLSPRGPRP